MLRAFQGGQAPRHWHARETRRLPSSCPLTHEHSFCSEGHGERSNKNHGRTLKEGPSGPEAPKSHLEFRATAGELLGASTARSLVGPQTPQQPKEERIGVRGHFGRLHSFLLLHATRLAEAGTSTASRVPRTAMTVVPYCQIAEAWEGSNCNKPSKPKP